MVVVSQRSDLMILEMFSNLNDSVTVILYCPVCPERFCLQQELLNHQKRHSMDVKPVISSDSGETEGYKNSKARNR